MTFKQIILVSDGESNYGMCPVEVSKRAFQNGIQVNTIGIVKNTGVEKPLVELEEIALNGGGLCQITNLENIATAMSMVTVGSIHNTIENIVNKELMEIMDVDIKEVPPKMRGKIVEMMDKLQEDIPIECLILLDVSGSMKGKISVAKRGILELLRFLKERNGSTMIGVITYPSEDSTFEILSQFTSDIDYLESCLNCITTGGVTPTGPALEGGIEMLLNNTYDEGVVFRDYII